MLLGILAGVFAGCGPTDPSSGAGAVASPPSRIVSLAPSLTEILFALGVGDRVVGVTSYCDYPPAAEALPKVGGLLDPNIEAIVALRPDLVVLLNTHQNVEEQLRSMGIRSLLVGGATVDQVLASMVEIGEACGCGERARKLEGRLRRRMRRIEQAVAGRPRPKVLLSIGRTMGEGMIKDIYVAGEDGYFSELIRLAGGRNACDEKTIAFPLVTQEGILQMGPDIIIELAADLEKTTLSVEDIQREWRTLEHVPAVEHGHVAVCTEDYVTVPGPRFIELLEHMARVIHPEVVIPPATAASDSEAAR